MQARLEMHRLLYSQIPILIVGLTFVVVAARHHASAESTLFILATFECLAVGATLLQSDLLKPLNRHVSLSDIGDAFRGCLPVALFNALVGAYSMSAASLPTYTVAFRLYQPWSLITASIAGVAYAGMARSMRHPANVGITVTRKLVLTGLAGASCLMLIIIGAGVAVICQFLPQYRNAILVLAILTPLIPIMGFNGLCTAFLSVAGKFNTLCRLAGFNLLVFAAVLLALIPPYGAAGAALALLIGETCNALIQAWLLRPYTVRPRMAKDGFHS
jgi:O-antigen/teichoic acid export membrane protein